MDLKTYQGSSMADALAKVKQDLGPDAVIMHTRTLKKGGVLGVGARTMVEITARKDQQAVPQAKNNENTSRRKPNRRPQRYYEPPQSSIPPAPPAEEAPVNRATSDRLHNSPAQPHAPRDIQSLQQEMGELRGMVRELLNRSSSPGVSIPSPEIPEELRDYYTCLIQNAVADEVAREILETARKRLEQCRAGLHAKVKKLETGNGNRQQLADHQQALRRLVPAIFMESVERMLPEAGPVDLNEDGRTKFVALIGPTGVGKTTTVAKLAAHFKLRENKRVGLITIDTYRIAAVDQLRAYAEIMNVPLKVVMTEKEMAEAVQSMREMDLVLIDTTGRSQNDTQRLDELKAFLDVVRDTAESAANAPSEKNRSESKDGNEFGGSLETHLVLSCTAHPGQMMQVAEKFSQLGVDRVVFTKLDEAVGIGVIFNVICRLKLRLSYLTTGQDVPDDIEVSRRRKIAEMILGRHSENDASRKQEASSVPVDHLA